MLNYEHKQSSLHSSLYNRIPQNHILKLIDNAVDFVFINKLLEDSYCKYYGRPAREPEMMIRLLVLQYLYNYSDVQLIEQTSVNLAYMWFIGINPEDELPDSSLLSKFRTQRLKETTLDDIIKEVVKQCDRKGILKGNGISVDCTHTEANTVKKVPERIMKHLAKKIFRSLESELKSIPANIDTNIPEYKKIEDHKQAKETMKNYLNKLIEEVENTVNIKDTSKTNNALKEAKEVLSDPKFIIQKGLRSLVDKDARVGYKSKTDSFFGYKVEYAMIPEDRIITAVNVHDGAYVDGTEFKELYKQTKECEIGIKEAYGDKAYFRKAILDLLEEEKIEAYIPVSEMVYRLDETKYSYCKDSDQWFCMLGNYTIEKKKVTRKDGRELLAYRFEKETCRCCHERKECIKGTSIANKLLLGLNTPEFYEYNQFTKTNRFKEKYKKRASHEWKNAEIKRFHGLDRCRGYGLKSIQTQAKLTALAVNLKRIAKMVSSLSEVFFYRMVIELSF